MLEYGNFLLNVIVKICTSVFGINCFSPLVLLGVFGLVVNKLVHL